MSNARCYELLSKMYEKLSNSAKIQDEIEKLSIIAKDDRFLVGTDKEKAERQRFKDLNKLWTANSIEEEKIFDEIQQLQCKRFSKF